MELATEPSLTPLDTETRASVPMSDAEFDSLLGSAEFQVRCCLGASSNAVGDRTACSVAQPRACATLSP